LVGTLSVLGSRFQFRSHWYVTCCSYCPCGFIHSIFAFIDYARFRLGRFAFTGSSLTVYKRYVFLSLKCCIICMTAFYMLVSNILGFKNFRTEKLQGHNFW